MRVAVDSQSWVPGYLSRQEAAAVPLTAITDMQALELMGTQKAGKTIFISWSGTGGVGNMCIPIAKAKGLMMWRKQERMLSSLKQRSRPLID